VPFESPAELRKVTVVRNEGPKQLLVNPATNFTTTLGSIDSCPYLAAHSVLSAYRNAGGRGVYNVVQQNTRVDVVPVQVLAANGSMRDITPVMSRPVTFPNATRTLPETVKLIADALTSQSGFKVIPLNLPGQLLEQVEIGASGESGADVIENLGASLNRTVSFQCLYEPNEKTYYLNLKSVAAAPAGGGTPVHGRIKTPKTGPQNSPFFDKTQ
jgi:ABC-type uncharacterized transport system permease subunit